MKDATRSKALRKVGVAAVAATAGAALAIGGAQFASAKSALATTGVNIRSGPGTSYNIVGGLVRGQSITTVGTAADGWIRVRFNGDAAYVSAQYLDSAGTDVSATPVMIYTKGVKVATAPLNVRQDPSLSAKVTGYISAGQQVTPTGKQAKGFAEVLYGGQRAWVSAQYLVSSANGLPSSSGTQYATADLFIRTSTDADFKIITTVSKGSPLKATGTTRNGYAQVIYNDAIRWVTAKYLSSKAVSGPSMSSSSETSGKASSASKSSSTSKSSEKPATSSPAPRAIGSRYATTELLVRTSSGSDYKTVTTVGRGDTVKITGRTSGGRAQIVYDGNVRWVTAQYLSNSKPRSAESSASASSNSSAPKTNSSPKTNSTPKTKSTPKTSSKASAQAVSDSSKSSGGLDSSYSGNSRNVSNGTWDELAMCESSGNWSISTGNGFYGGLQFTLQTWHGFGGAGMPNKASRAEQIKVAERILAVQGWGAWPACSSKLGLR